MTSEDAGPLEEAWYHYPLQVLVLAVVYAIGGWLGLTLTYYQENASLIWPPTGLAIAALILWGPRLWTGIFLGAYTVSLLTGLPASTALGIAVGNTLMPVVAVHLMVRVFDFRPTLERVRDVVVLIVVGGAMASIISASIGVFSLWLGERISTSDVGVIFSIWWRGDFLGVVGFAPVLLLLRMDPSAWRGLFRIDQLGITTGVGLLLIVFTYTGLIPSEWERIPFRLIVPLLLWAAISVGTRGTVFLYFWVLVASIVGTVLGHGPLADFDFLYASEQLWLYLIVLGCTSLTLAAAVAQRNEARSQVESEIIDKMRIEREQSIARERERILRDMHDGIGGQLTSVLSMVQRGRATNDEISEALRRTLDDMRILIDSLEAGDEGLPKMIGRLRARLEAVLKRNGLRATWDVEPLAALDTFNPTQALHTIHVIQEAVANVVQHAQATEIRIRVFAADPSAQTLAVEIADNGVGAKPQTTVGGRGMRNMEARAEALGAELRFEIGDSGRSVLLLIPVSTLG